MKKRQEKEGTDNIEGRIPIKEDDLVKCPFSWEKLIEMKDSKIEFFAGDGYKRLRIIEMDEKTRNIYMICELGKITWPLSYRKLEEVHSKIHSGKTVLLPFEIDKLIPTWGNFVAGLFRHFGCNENEF